MGVGRRKGTVTTDQRRVQQSPGLVPGREMAAFYKYAQAEKRLWEWEREDELWVAHADGSGACRIEPGKYARAAKWSPVANTIAYLSVPIESAEEKGITELKRTEIKDGSPEEPFILRDTSEKATNFCWLPAGDKFAYSTTAEYPHTNYQPAIKMIPAQGGEAETLILLDCEEHPIGGSGTMLVAHGGGIHFSPGGDYFNFFRYSTSGSLNADGVGLYLVSTGAKEEKSLGGMLSYSNWVRWSPGGDLLAFISGGGREALSNKRLSIVPVNQLDKALMITPEGCVDRDLAWSPEGDVIAVSRAKSSSWKKQEEWPPASIWLVNADGSQARQISTGGETAGCFDFYPWWTRGGEHLMWVRVQGEKASIWQAEVDGSEQSQVFDGLDIALGFYGAFKWDEVMAWHPGESYHPLPFSGEQVRETKSVGDDFILIERVTSSDHNYYLDHPSFNGIKNIVSFIETAKFKDCKDGELRFTARGGSDTGNFQFPYQLIYNPNTEELRREDLFLTLNEQEQVSFGKDGWKQILSSFEIEDSALAFDFKAAAGEVLAGGRRLPHTIVQYDEKSNDLVFSFLNVELADTLKENMIVKSLSSKHVKEVKCEQLSGRLDDQSGPQRPIVRVRIALNGMPLYNARASYSEGTGYEESDRCTVIFR